MPTTPPYCEGGAVGSVTKSAPLGKARHVRDAAARGDDRGSLDDPVLRLGPGLRERCGLGRGPAASLGGRGRGPLGGAPSSPSMRAISAFSD